MRSDSAEQYEPVGKTGRLFLRDIDGRRIYFDDEGFLFYPEDWTEGIAEQLAAECGIGPLDDARWRVIRFMREFYLTNGRGPLNRQLSKGTGFSLLMLEGLFPGGIKHGARRLAGMPNPKTCL